MIGGVTRRGGLPGRSDGYPLIRGWTCLIWNSCQLPLAEAFIIKSDNRKPEHCKVAARAASESRRALNVIVRHLPALFFVVYVHSGRSIILRNCTPGWRCCYKKTGVFFSFRTPLEQVTSPTWQYPPSCWEALNKYKTDRQGWRVLKEIAV